MGLVEEMLFLISQDCIEYTAKTIKLLLRQKVKALPHFSRELTDWPIVFSEFKRSNSNYQIKIISFVLIVLKGTARKIVKVLLLSLSNIPRIIKMLEISYYYFNFSGCIFCKNRSHEIE